MNHQFTFGLRWKLNLLIGAIVVATMAVFVGLDVYHERQSLIMARAEHMEELTQHVAWVIQNRGDEDLQRLVMNYEHAMNRHENHEYRLLILNGRSEVVAAANPQLLGTIMDEKSLWENFEGVAVDTTTQISIQDTKRMMAALPAVVRNGKAREEDQLLTILISGSLDDIRETLKASLITHTFHLLITILAVMAAVNLALSRFVLQPIQSLITDMKQMERGEWRRQLPVKADDEIGALTAGYNNLGQSLMETVERLVRAEKLASVGLVAIHLSRALKKPIGQIRSSAKFLCQRNAFDRDSAHAVGRIFDQTEKIYAISEKFSLDFSGLFEDTGQLQSSHVTAELDAELAQVSN